MWTPLHAALGEPAGPLTYEMFERAVEQGVRETDALDWKATLPGSDPIRRKEFQKDVAALANTGGGMLVYGMSERRGIGAAEEITPVSTSESETRRLGAIAAENIHPSCQDSGSYPSTRPAWPVTDCSC